MNNIKEIKSTTQASHDLSLIRETLKISEKFQEGTLFNLPALKGLLYAQVIALSVAASLFIVEWLEGGIFTTELALSRYDSSFQVDYLSQVAMFLLCCVSLLYYPLWKSSRQNEENLSIFLSKRISSLKLMSFSGDLAIKFGVYSILVLAGVGQYVAPLLCLFLLDYILQRRYFHFPESWGLGMALFPISVTLFLLKSPTGNLLYPLGLFVFLSLVSVVNIAQEIKKKEKSLN